MPLHEFGRLPLCPSPASRALPPISGTGFCLKVNSSISLSHRQLHFYAKILRQKLQTYTPAFAPNQCQHLAPQWRAQSKFSPLKTFCKMKRFLGLNGGMLLIRKDRREGEKGSYTQYRRCPTQQAILSARATTLLAAESQLLFSCCSPHSLLVSPLFNIAGGGGRK